MSSFESPEQFIQREERRRMPTAIKLAADKAEGVFAEDAMNPRHFADISPLELPKEWRAAYTNDAIRRDLEQIQKLEDSWKIPPKVSTNNEKTEDQAKQWWATTEGKRYARALEGILFMHAELSDWLGPNVMMRKTSDFDDYVNGIDLVAEFAHPNQNERHLALAIDVTFSTRSATDYGKSDKTANIKRAIERGALGNIKYFEGRKDGREYRGPLLDVPRVVIGAEKKTLEELSTLWINGKNKELAKHTVQYVLLREMEEQLGCYMAYAEKVGNTTAAKKYKEAYEIIRDIVRQKNMPEEGEWEEDRVLQEIQRQLEMIFLYFR
jgi:hypothetical protein